MEGAGPGEYYLDEALFHMSTHLLLAPSQWGAAQRTYLAPLLRLPPLHLADTGWRGETGTPASDNRFDPDDLATRRRRCSRLRHVKTSRHLRVPTVTHSSILSAAAAAASTRVPLSRRALLGSGPFVMSQLVSADLGDTP